MRTRTAVFVAALAAAASFAVGQETQRPLADTYATLADVILGAKRTEANLVRSILESHRAAATAKFHAGDHGGAAAEMALFANEGDNAVGGVRKRLLEGGHHHNAEGEAQGVFDPGFVLVTKKAKQEILAAVASLQGAGDDRARGAALAAFEKAAASVLAKD